jgi:cytochrome c biogenesis factor
MNETIAKATNYIVTNVKAHPLQSVITTLTAIGIVFTFVSNTHVELYIYRQQVQANTDSINTLNAEYTTDHQDIITLQQIAKDNVDAQNRFTAELQTLNNNFTQYLFKQIK